MSKPWSNLDLCKRIFLIWDYVTSRDRAIKSKRKIVSHTLVLVLHNSVIPLVVFDNKPGRRQWINLMDRLLQTVQIKSFWGKMCHDYRLLFPTTNVLGSLSFPGLISMRWHWHLADCFFNLLHWLKTIDSQNWHHIQFSGLLDEEKKKTKEKICCIQRALSQSQWNFLFVYFTPIFF